eukprot:scaffold2081_cov382-Prasinococcus_capsulatus_cf.AAC.1
MQARHSVKNSRVFEGSFFHQQCRLKRRHLPDRGVGLPRPPGAASLVKGKSTGLRTKPQASANDGAGVHQPAEGNPAAGPFLLLPISTPAAVLPRPRPPAPSSSAGPLAAALLAVRGVSTHTAPHRATVACTPMTRACEGGRCRAELQEQVDGLD